MTFRSLFRSSFVLRRGSTRSLNTTASRIPINIVEVGPRDGLQNEKGTVSVETKVELIDRLGRAGLRTVEVGSFVSPKWVPQMAGTKEVLTRMQRLPGVRYPVLVPNQRGLDDLLAVGMPHDVSVFTGATDAFTRANTNASVAESLEALAPVVQRALERGLRVRGYVSVAVVCPYSGPVDPARVVAVAKALVGMGCYEVSLGDTVGAGTPATVGAMLDAVAAAVPLDKLAGHFHDTYGTGVSNVLTALAHGIRTIDSSVGGLGGCPYSPGATGNVATEDVLYALRGSSYCVLDPNGQEVDVGRVAQVGAWISEVLGRDNASRAGKALWGKKMREGREGDAL